LKILYAIQGTGNGHMSRAQVFIPILSKYGDVDVLISSKDHDIKINHPIKYHINGLGFTFGKNGGIDYWQSFFKFKIIRLLTTLIFAATRSSAYRCPASQLRSAPTAGTADRLGWR
jgi:UDP-N-acetylglucosamine:LPS N-acetylglucosamine transferase